MDHTALENRLQSEIDALVIKNKDVFSALLGVANTKGDIHWSVPLSFCLLCSCVRVCIFVLEKRDGIKEEAD
jgi:hypothetical protein